MTLTATPTQPPGSATPTADCTTDPHGVGCAAGQTPTPSSGGGSFGSCDWYSGGLAYFPGGAPWMQPNVIAFKGYLDANGWEDVGLPPYDQYGAEMMCNGNIEAALAIGTVQVQPTPTNFPGLWALAQASWNPPSIATSPSLTTAAVVNLPTYLYLNPGAWQTVTATATAGGVSATITAIPVQVAWTPGDGGSVTCDGPGVPYNVSWGSTPPPSSTGACTYTYSTTGTYTLSATASYDVTWTSTGAGGAGGDLGLVPGPTNTVSVTVDEIASVVTS
jgi:hypothetical protein